MTRSGAQNGGGEAAFAVVTLRRWWTMVGNRAYPGAERLLVTADGMGAVDHRGPWLTSELARFAADARLRITVCHLPPGTSRWTGVEYQMSDRVALNLRGLPVTGHLVVIGVIGAPDAATRRHQVRPPGDAHIAEIGRTGPANRRIPRPAGRGYWNYTVSPD